MKSHPAKAEPRSPERRLGLLYFASHSTIAILLALGEVYPLEDLWWRRFAIQAIAQAARQEALDQSPGESVLSILGTQDPSDRRERVENLHAVAQHESDRPLLDRHRRASEQPAPSGGPRMS